MSEAEIGVLGTQDQMLRVLRQILAVLEDTNSLTQAILDSSQENLAALQRIEQLLAQGAFAISYKRILPPAAIEVQYEKMEREET